MIRAVHAWLDELSENGFALLPGILAPGLIVKLLIELEHALQGRTDAIRSDAGSVYAARNVLELCPAAATVWRQPPLPEFLAALLGPGFGLVRALYFDKPPERSWALPWHKDLTIAVRRNRLPGNTFTHPTVKAGVPHVEAPRELLDQMATVRLHLDEVTQENGPLKVIPGSHRTGKALHLGDTPPQSILAQPGDALVMRPLLAHSSGHSHPTTRRHRRILHLEFAASTDLPDGYAWYEFRPCALLGQGEHPVAIHVRKIAPTVQ